MIGPLIVGKIKRALVRGAFNGKSFGIEAGRGTGKSTALLQFAAATILLDDGTHSYAIVYETEAIKRKMEIEYKVQFPHIAAPTFLSIYNVCYPHHHIYYSMVFVDDVFSLSFEQLDILKSIAGVVIGVGTKIEPEIRTSLL